MKQISACWLIVIIILSSFDNFAQTDVSPCGTTEWMQYYNSSPEKGEWLKFVERINANRPKRLLNSRSAVDTIPVVVHVVWSTPQQNIPDSVIFRQIQILNTDFGKLNWDTVNIPVPFKPLAAASPYFFCLATRDPNGAFTTGIVRKQTTHGVFATLYEIESSSTGGDDIWPRDYLNIYCGDINNSLAGVAQHNFNVCAVDFTYFGLNNLSNLGRTATHEVGHSFGLYHPWGTEAQGGPYNCNSDDNINDTPVQFQPSSNCPSFPTFDSCTPTGDGIMYMNFMDYSSGSCRYMFTAEQVARMTDTINFWMPELLTSKGCVPLQPVDAGCTFLFSPLGSSCSTLQPSVQFRNWGLNPLTSVNINYTLDGGSPVSIPWTGNLNNYDPDTVVLPSLTAAPGWHILKLYTTNPNGITDQDASNDTLIKSFNVSPTFNVPSFEGFDAFGIPTGWIVYDPEYNGSFGSTGVASHSGAGSIYIYNQGSVSSIGNIDELSAKFNLAGSTHPYLSFYIAYTYSPGWGYTDTLEIFASADCGLTFDRLYKKYDSTLITAPTLPFSQHWVPTSGQWRKDSVDLSAYISSPNDLIIKFRNTKNYGLELFLDEVRVADVPLSVYDLEANTISLFPDPNKGSFLLNTGNEIFTGVSICNSLSQIVYSGKLNPAYQHSFNLDLAKGWYLLSLKSGDKIIHKKFVVE